MSSTFQQFKTIIFILNKKSNNYENYYILSDNDLILNWM